jgi:glycosyltransferase involved in cell wall biosynthesis
VIVSDGSTDGTDEIVQKYAAIHPWIELLRLPERTERHFAAKANAFNAGFARLSEVPYDIVGNLDADITFEPEYFRFLMERFVADPRLGVAGTPFVEGERVDQHTYSHRFAQLEHVSGAVQLFRRACFDEIGGYIPIKGGAIDWIAVTTARMKGWNTRTFPEKVCFHHRKIGTGHGSAWLVRYRYGQKAYYVGAHPLWAFLRGLFQMRQKPLIVGGLLFQFGYWSSLIKRVPRPVPPELIAFHRREQMSRLRRLVSGPGNA